MEKIKWEMDRRSRPYTNIILIFLLLGVSVVALAFFLRYTINNYYLEEETMRRYCAENPSIELGDNGVNCTSVRLTFPPYIENNTFLKQNIIPDISWQSGKCCYPSECPEASNNPPNCTCLYTVNIVPRSLYP